MNCRNAVWDESGIQDHCRLFSPSPPLRVSPSRNHGVLATAKDASKTEKSGPSLTARLRHLRCFHFRQIRQQAVALVCQMSHTQQ